MKSDFVDLQHNNTNSSQNMFSKLHHHQHPFSHHFQLSRDAQAASEEDTNSHNSAAAATPTPAAGSAAASKSRQLQEHTTTTGGDGATIEVVRRPRGRPPGSKNKPKPPVFVTREPEPGMSPYILEVPGGNDVVETVSNFCRRRGIGICVLTGSGAVAKVTLRQPSATQGSTITFHGWFDILSISATFLPLNNNAAASFPPIPNIFAISLAGPQGQIVGGSVVGPLVAADTVFVIAATFTNPSYHRLTGQEDQQQQRASVSAGGNEGQSPVGSSGGGGASESGHVAGGESCGGMSIYSCHLPPSGGDVIWAPTARQPPPPY